MTEITKTDNELTYRPEDDGNEPDYSNNDLLPSTVRVLKPMSLMKLGEEVVSLYRAHGIVILKSIAIINLPTIAISFCTIGLAVISGLALVSSQAFIAGGLLLALAGMPFQLLAMVAAPAVIAKIVSDSFLMKEVDLWESLDLVWQKIGTLVSAIFCSWIAIAGAHFAYAVTIGIILAILVGGGVAVALIAANFGATAMLLAQLGTGLAAILTVLMFILCSLAFLGTTYVMLFVSPVVAVIENKSWFDAPKRSLELIFKSSGSAMRFLGSLLVVWLSIGLTSLIVLGPVMLAAQALAATTGIMAIFNIGQTIVGLLSALIFVPVGSAATALLYYDHRIRYENFSLDDLVKADAQNPGKNQELLD